MLSRTADGTGRNAPRELIHLMNQAREEQVRLLETGSAEPGNGLLFEPAALRNAMREVSRVRFEQTFALEYPTLAGWARALRNKKSDQTIDTLKQIWDVDRDEARTRTRQLVDAGFFKEPKRNGHTYSIPFLYRPALSIVQGVESASSSPRE